MAVGEVGVSLKDPDDYALDVLGDILNSFGGRLFDQIRSRQVRHNLTTQISPQTGSPAESTDAADVNVRGLRL